MLCFNTHDTEHDGTHGSFMGRVTGVRGQPVRFQIIHHTVTLCQIGVVWLYQVRSTKTSASADSPA